jgi:hypothetical protein
LQRSQQRERLVQFGRSAVIRVRKQLSPRFQRLESGVPEAQTSVRDELIEGMVRTWDALGAPEVLMREAICARISNREEPLALVLSFGVVIEVLDNGKLNVGAAMQLGIESVSPYAVDQTQPVVVDAGSVEEEQAVRDASAWILGKVEEWLTEFAARAG